MILLLDLLSNIFLSLSVIENKARPTFINWRLTFTSRYDVHFSLRKSWNQQSPVILSTRHLKYNGGFHYKIYLEPILQSSSLHVLIIFRWLVTIFYEKKKFLLVFFLSSDNFSRYFPNTVKDQATTSAGCGV